MLIEGLPTSRISIFESRNALFLHQAISDAVSNIKVMPAKHTSFPNGPRVYGITSGHRVRLARELVLDSEYLKSFGELLVPEAIWRVLARFNVWIERALVAEWIRIMKDYLAGQRRPVAEETFYLATRWSDPERDVRVVRELALDLLKRDRLFCVWTGKKLKEDSLDMDHCFPWSAWPCGDLWNLLPALRSVNQNQKSDRLPSATVSGSEAVTVCRMTLCLAHITVTAKRQRDLSFISSTAEEHDFICPLLCFRSESRGHRKELGFLSRIVD